MSDDKGFRKMGDLVEALRHVELALRNGTLGIAGLDQACIDARDLYERLVVLRHKAREKKTVDGAGNGTDLLAPMKGVGGEQKDLERVVVTPATPTDATKERVPTDNSQQASVIRLDTRPLEPRQTSLIEAIEATESEPAPSAKTAREYLKETKEAKVKAPATLAEKLEKAHIEDLGKAISISHKFWFTAELFNADPTAYETGVELLNSAADFSEAKAFFDSEVASKLKKPADPEALTTFLELLHRRFS